MEPTDHKAVSAAIKDIILNRDRWSRFSTAGLSLPCTLSACSAACLCLVLGISNAGLSLPSTLFVCSADRHRRNVCNVALPLVAVSVKLQHPQSLTTDQNARYMSAPTLNAAPATFRCLLHLA